MASQKTTENELRQQLESAKNDKKSIQKEFEEMRYRQTQTDSDKKNLAQQLDALRRERAVFLKKIEMVSLTLHDRKQSSLRTLLFFNHLKQKHGSQV